MENNSFNRKLVAFLLENEMPSAQGPEAEESGLVMLTSKESVPVCASYGSGEEMAKTVYMVLSDQTSVRAVIMSAVALYVKLHPESTSTKKFLALLETSI